MKKQGFFAASMILIGSAVISKLLGAVFKIPLTQLLGGTGMGYFSAAYGLFLPAYAVVAMGLTTAVAKLTAEFAATGNLRAVLMLKKNALYLFMIIGITVSGIIFLLARPLALYVAASPMAAPAIAAMAPAVFLGCVLSVYRGYYEGMRNMFPTALSQVAEGVVKVALGLFLSWKVLDMAINTPLDFLNFFKPILPLLGLAAKEWTVSELALPLAAAGAICGVTLSVGAGLVFVIIRGLFDNRKLLLSDKPETASDNNATEYSEKVMTGKLLKFMMPVAVGALVSNLTSLADIVTVVRGLDKAILNQPKIFEYLNMPSSQVSTFIYGSFSALSLTVFGLVPSFTNMFGKSILPALSESWALKDKCQVNRLINSVLSTTVFVAAPASLGIFFLSKEILYFIFPGRSLEITASASSLCILGLGVLPLALSVPIFSILQAIGKPFLPVKALIVGVIVKLAGNLVLIRIPELNILGAAISTVLCYTVVTVIAMRHLKLQSKYKLSITGTFLKPIYSAVLCGIGAVFAKDMFSKIFSDSIALLCGILCGGIIYMIVMVVLMSPAKIKGLILGRK